MDIAIGGIRLICDMNLIYAAEETGVRETNRQEVRVGSNVIEDAIKVSFVSHYLVVEAVFEYMIC